MVKLVSFLLIGLVVADDIVDPDEFAMLQSVSAKKVSLSARSKNISDWRDDEDCSYLGLGAFCPISVMDDLDANYQAEETSLDAKIDTLQAAIEDQQNLTAQVVLTNDGIDAKIVAALSKTANAKADILLIVDKVETMKTNFDIKFSKLQDTLDAVEETVNNVLQNSISVAEFLVKEDVPDSDTGLLQEKWFFPPAAIKSIWSYVEVKFPKVADATENILVDNGQVYQWKVDDARAEFKEKAEALEQTISGLESALVDEESELTSALSATPELKASYAIANAERRVAANAFQAVKAGQRELKQKNTESLSKLKAEISLLKQWISLFKETFTNKLFNALAEKM